MKHQSETAIKRQILYPFANVMGLFFPVGKLENGGTCAFATSQCLEKCCAHHPGSGTKIGFEKKRMAYSFFLDNTADKISRQILRELKKADCNIFTWFASGDCPSFLTDKYFDVIQILDKKGIIQTGVTRNSVLWGKCNELSNDSRVLLTVENIEECLTYSEKVRLYSLPNYKIGAIDIYKVVYDKIYVRSGCGGSYYDDHIKSKGKVKAHLKLDCKACYVNKTGCFTVFEEETK